MRHEQTPLDKDRTSDRGADALRLGSSDGHARGIYPFVYLRDLARAPAADSAPKTA